MTYKLISLLKVISFIIWTLWFYTIYCFSKKVEWLSIDFKGYFLISQIGKGRPNGFFGVPINKLAFMTNHCHNGYESSCVLWCIGES